MTSSKTIFFQLVQYFDKSDSTNISNKIGKTNNIDTFGKIGRFDKFNRFEILIFGI